MTRVAVVEGVVKNFSQEEIRELHFFETTRIGTKSLLEKLNISINDVNTILFCSIDVWHGHTISHVYAIDPAGAWLKNDSKVAEDGTLALAYAYIRILSGHFKNALVVSECLHGICDFHSVTNIIFDPYYWRRLGLDATSFAAIQASYYMSKHRELRKR